MTKILLTGTSKINSINQSAFQSIQINITLLHIMATVWSNIGSYDIFYMVIYVTLIDLTEHGNRLFSATT